VESFNWYGTYMLTAREVKRFMRVYNQTIFTPIVSALIFLAIFVLALGSKSHEINGIKFVNFMGYGLIIMSIVQNAFANSSSSFVMSKILGYIIDILTPPLGSAEIIIAFSIGATIRGVIVGIVVSLSLFPFIDYHLYHPFLLVFYVLASCTLLGKLGILTGLIANSFDQLSAVTNYIVTPLSFLSGTFYSVQALPQIFQLINKVNPFFYMIDGFRYCLTNRADAPIITGIIILIITNIIMYFVLVKLIDKGWRIKA
jgi:ABC-2 type transport system permease protein